MSRRRHALFAATILFAGLPCSMQSQQSILLQIRPRAGDTLAVRLDQRIEMTGTSKGSAAGTRHMATVTEVFSRAIVESVSGAGATVLAVTDSIRTSASRGDRPGKPRRVRGGDNTVRLRLSTDGGAEVIDNRATDEMRAIFGQMPAMLSRKPVAVGERWKREMRVPIAAKSGALGRVRATFRLDSLSDGRDMAYISMRGTLSHDHSDGSGSDLEGSMTGSIALNRTLGWIVRTHAVIDVTSLVQRGANAEPMRVHTIVTQMLRAGIAR